MLLRSTTRTKPFFCATLAMASRVLSTSGLSVAVGLRLCSLELHRRLLILRRLELLEIIGGTLHRGERIDRGLVDVADARRRRRIDRRHRFADAGEQIAHAAGDVLTADDDDLFVDDHREIMARSDRSDRNLGAPEKRSEHLTLLVGDLLLEIAAQPLLLGR